MVSYVVILIAAVILPRYYAVSLFGLAGAALLLLFIGIHNAWDTVTYVTVAGLDKSSPTGEAAAPAEGKTQP
jgi:hypothetical protein